MRRAFVIAVMLLLTACSSRLSLALPSGAPVHVVTPSSSYERLLQPTGEDYGHLQDWLAKNQSGWSQVYATNPNGGIFVSCGSFRLQFIGSTVFVMTSKGLSAKLQTKRYRLDVELGASGRLFDV